MLVTEDEKLGLLLLLRDSIQNRSSEKILLVYFSFRLFGERKATAEIQEFELQSILKVEHKKLASRILKHFKNIKVKSL